MTETTTRTPAEAKLARVKDHRDQGHAVTPGYHETIGDYYIVWDADGQPREVITSDADRALAHRLPRDLNPYLPVEDLLDNARDGVYLH